jgi:hypothetical protein
MGALLSASVFGLAFVAARLLGVKKLEDPEVSEGTES